jgi:hypothetical protein
MSSLPGMILNLKQNLENDPSKASSWGIIDDYFNFFGKEEWKKDLWLLLVGTLTSDEMFHLQKGIDRHNLFFFYEYTTLVLEATQNLHQHHNKKSRKQNGTNKNNNL